MFQTPPPHPVSPSLPIPSSNRPTKYLITTVLHLHPPAPDYHIPEYEPVAAASAALSVRRFATVKEASEYFTPRWRDRSGRSGCVKLLCEMLMERWFLW